MTKDTPPPRDTPGHGVPEPPEGEESRARGGRGSNGTERAGSAGGEATSADFYRLLVESVQDYAIFALDPAGRVLTWSAGAARLKGYARTEIIGRHFSAFYPPEDVAAGKPDRELDVAARAGRLEDEGWRVRKDGTRFWASVVITALRDELGRLVGFAKVTRDLTERRHSEEALRRSEERFRLLVETVRDYAIFMLDPEGHVATWNAGAERIKGYRAEEIIGRHFSTFYPEEKVASGFPQYELEVAAREGRFEDEGWRVRKDGTRFWANVIITALRDRAGNLVGFAKVTRDLTQRRAAEEQARRLIAEQAARAEAQRLQTTADAAREEAQAAARRVAFLAEASAQLAGSLDAEATLRTVADLAVPALADWCFVEVLERGRVRPAAVSHVNPAMVQLAYDVLARHPIDLSAPFGTGKVLRTGEPELYPEVPDEALMAVAQDEEHLAILRRVGFRSSLSVPLKDPDGRAVGVLSLVSAESDRRFGEADLAMAEELARRAGAALASARLYAAGQAALRRATALQRVSAALVGALSAAEVAQVVVRHGCAAVGARACSLALLDAEGRTFRTLASEGYDEQTARAFERFPLASGRPLSDAVLESAPHYLSSLDDFDARYPEIAPVMRATGFAAYVALPVRGGVGVAGGLSFSFAERREFDAEDRAFFETLAAQAGQALERARLVEAERAARAEAEAASRAKSEFLATMSHELRTPLNAIGGYAQLIDMGLRGPVTPEQREDLERIRRSQLHLTGLVDEVLSYARLESGAVTYDLRPTLVADVVAAAAPLVEPERVAKRLTLDVRLPEFTGRPPIYVLADRDKLQQIVVNLLSNAVRFTPEGGRVTVELLNEPDEHGMAVLQVRDTGIGIPADKLESIFEPFVQVGRSLSNPGEGTGLGLAISRDLARGMGGDLTAESTPGAGSTFTLTLPAA